MVCCVSTFLKAPTCRAIRATSSMQSPLLSTIVRARRSVGRHPPRPFKIVYPLQNDGVLRRPVEPKQYTSIAFGMRWKEAGVRPSMGTVGDAYDNAMCESFFGTLECELLDRRRFRSQIEARMAVFDYLEGFYNPRRRHSALGYTSPIEYERTSCSLPESQAPNRPPNRNFN